jgi:sugar/nucleoside kinase (ribokinase family)
VDVLCAGILVADAFAQPINSLPAPGELKTTAGFLMSAGGCAVNVAVALRKLSRSVAIAGKVGTDLFGDFVIAELQRQGIDTAYVQRTPAHPTSATVIVNVTGEDRRYLHCIGANSDFRGSDLNGEALDGIRLLYVGGYLAMPSFGSEHLRLLMKSAKERGVITVLDVVIPAGFEEPMRHVAPALEFTDYFLPNDDEARALTGMDGLNAQAAALHEVAPGCTHVITLGSAGSLSRTRDEIVRTPALEVNAVDESGAGDAFAAGLITGILEGYPLDRALRLAAAAGASCTRALGCSAGLFTFGEALACADSGAIPDAALVTTVSRVVTGS